MLLLTFTIVAALAAGFLIASTIGESVRAQTRQIGLLKAVGFTRRQLALVYLGTYQGLALVASLAGLAMGGLAASLILRDLAAKFGETLARPPPWIGLAVPASILLVTALFVLWPVRRAVQMDAVQARGMLITLAVFFPVGLYRARLEEKALAQRFGEDWKAYTRCTHFLLPWGQDRI